MNPDEIKRLANAFDEKAIDRFQVAAAIDRLRSELRNASSIKEDVPVLTELFHEGRMASGQKTGRYVALYDLEKNTWKCRSVNWLDGGTHYRDTGADLKLHFGPMALASTEDFKRNVICQLDGKVKAARQNASSFKGRADDKRNQAEYYENRE